METKRIPFVGGPLDGEDYKWTTAKAVLVPDAADMITGYDRERDEVFTLFGEHRYEMRCYVNDGEKVYRLEHAGYTRPTLRPGTVAWNPEPPEVT